MRRSKWLALLLALTLALAACGGQPQNGGETNAPPPQQEEQSGNAGSQQEAEDESDESVEASAPVEEVYTAADMQDIDPYAPILSYWDVDFSKQPAFTSAAGLDAYFKDCVENRCRNIVFSCSRDVRVELNSADFCDTYHLAWVNPKMQPGEFGKHYVISITYYPGDNVAWAYLNNDKSMLCEEELVLYDTAVAWLEENISEDMTDYDKCVAIHDYISGSVKYSNELLAALNTSYTFDWGITAYGAMIDHLTICQGYADAFDMLTSMLGMECTQVAGSGGGELHNWVLIQLDGSWYHVDCTWDATAFPGGDGTCSKAYLFVSDEQMRRTHSWEASLYPEATDSSYWYYEKLGRKVSSQEELEALVSEPLQNGQQADVYVENLTQKQVTDYVQSLGGKFHTAEYQSGVVLCAWVEE